MKTIINIKKYYTKYQGKHGYLKTFHKFLEHPYLKRQDEPFGRLKSEYEKFADEATDKLLDLYRDFEIDITHKKFRQNEELRSLVAEMLLSLSLSKCSALDAVLEAMNFDEDFHKFFVDLNLLCERSEELFSNNETDGLEGILFSDLVMITQVQIKIALEYEFGFYDQKTTYPNSKKELIKLNRRIEYALKNEKPLDDLNAPESLFIGENREVWKSLALSIYRRNNSGSQNLSALAGMSYMLLKTLNPDKSKHGIMVDLYGVFEIVYGYKELDATPDDEDPVFIATKPGENIVKESAKKTVYDYKLDAVRSILGLT
jgi:hypothetical protein